MPSSSGARRLGRAALSATVVLALACTWSSLAAAQEPARGFAVERLYPSAPGGGWMVMDTLDMHGELGGAIALTSGYARRPLVVTDGTQHLAVVSDQAFVGVGVAATYDRLRLYVDVVSPLAVVGRSGAVGPYQFTAPDVGVGSNPDTISDVRVGMDARLVGSATSPFRLGVGAQLIVNSGERFDYVTDNTYRGMGRVLVAGELGAVTYAGHLGVHFRPLDDGPAPGSPRGNELLYGVAVGPRLPVTSNGSTAVVVGPELFGESAFQSFLGTNTSNLEGLLSARIEGTRDDGEQLRAKLGIGAGLVRHFGAPEWRLVVAVELFDHSTDRDKDGISDSKDACPDVPGIATRDPRTNGCPSDRDGDGVPDALDACPDTRGVATTDPATNGCAPPTE